MEDKNEIDLTQNFDLSKIEKTIVNIGKDLENDIKNIPEIKEEDLYYFFYMKNIYNEKCTKLKEKEKFIKLIYILNQYLKERNDFIFLYFKKVNINLLFIILNGFITAEIKDSKQKKILLGTIKAIIDLFFSKDLFYFIYNKLSKIFRRFNTEQNKEILFDKFSKEFDIWNLLFDINKKNKINTDYFAFIGNQVLTLDNNEDKYQFDYVDIIIEFYEGINYLNESNNDFSLLDVQYADYGLHSVMLEGILSEKEKKNINNIFIRIDGESVCYLFDVEKDFKLKTDDNINKIMEFNRTSYFSKIEILKNYIGKIQSIKILAEFKDDDIKKMIYKIIPSENMQGYEVISSEGNHDFIKLYFSNKVIYNKIYKSLLYEDIRYYGGMESFIPLIKIIKYFISAFSDNKEKIEILSNMLIEVIKNIIKLVLYSNNNFENFQKILSSLIAGLAEINHVYPDNLKNDL